MAVLFISTGRMPFLAPSFDDADSLFALVITAGLYLHHVEVCTRWRWYIKTQLVAVYK